MIGKTFITGLMTLILAVGAFPARAEDLPTLTIESSSGTVVYDRSQLEEMGMVAIDTTTPWTEGVVHFEGVPLDKLLEAAGATGTVATVTALNDYSVDIPTSDFAQFGPILAIKRNGDYMPVSSQGPFFVIYPFDSNPVLQQQPYHGRAAWQVKSITVQ